MSKGLGRRACSLPLPSSALTQTQTQTFQSSGPTQVHFFPPHFNRKRQLHKKQSGNTLLCLSKAKGKNGCHLLSTTLLWKAAMTDICFSKHQISYINQSFTVSVSATPGDGLYSQAALKAQVLSCKIKSKSPAITMLKYWSSQFLFFFLKKKKKTDRLLLH